MPILLKRNTTMTLSLRLFAMVATTSALALPTLAQEQSVNPGINDSFRDPDVNEFTNRFEVESREIFARRREIVAACQIQPGETVADIGAGTGLFTLLFADAVGKEGRVIAVDISQKFLDHIASASREEGRRNIDTLLATAASTELAPASIDVAFICDTYHHFEFPQKTLASLFQAVKPGGRVILIDFRRIPGTSSDWVLNHVRAGQEVFEAEIIAAGFEKVSEEPELLQENYFVTFKRGSAGEGAPEGDLPRRLGPGRGAGRGRGPDAAMRADQEAFHYLLEHHAEIRRTVAKTDNGVQTLTESDQPEVAKKIQEHVAAMHRRVEEGRGLRYWDDLFAALFEHHASIRMSVENTEKGVRVEESSDNPVVVALIQAHAEVVSKFVAKGFDEARRNHAVPAAATSSVE
jgi:ubiquinone/menaquinone biosynthesis C-methylase UbiE